MWSSRQLSKYCCHQQRQHISLIGCQIFQTPESVDNKGKVVESRFISQITKSKRFHYGKQPSTITELVMTHCIIGLTRCHYGGHRAWGAPKTTEAGWGIGGPSNEEQDGGREADVFKTKLPLCPLAWPALPLFWIWPHSAPLNTGADTKWKPAVGSQRKYFACHRKVTLRPQT